MAKIRSELTPGIQVIISDDLPEASALLVDADGLLLDRGELFMKKSFDANIEMADLPDGTGATINLFHSEAIAMRLVRTFSMAAHRPCATLITGISW